MCYEGDFRSWVRKKVQNRKENEPVTERARPLLPIRTTPTGETKRRREEVERKLEEIL